MKVFIVVGKQKYSSGYNIIRVVSTLAEAENEVAFWTEKIKATDYANEFSYGFIMKEVDAPVAHE